MSATGLEVFDKTVHTTNLWLKEIGEDIGPDRRRSYDALRAVLFALRDRLTVEEAAHLAAQLPILIRGIFYEGYKPSGKPERIRSKDEFLEKVADQLKRIRPLGAEDASRAVFRVLQRHGFEQSELEVPRDRLEEWGARVDVVAPEAGEIRGWQENAGR